MEETKKTYCVCVDGSKFSQYGWEVTYQELYTKGDRIVVVHISNPDKEGIIPYESQPKTLFLKYQTVLGGKLKEGDYEIVIEPRIKGSEHALENLKKISEDKKVDCIVIGYQGHKTNQLKKELSKGNDFMIKNFTIPVMIIKEKSIRKNKDNGEFTWLFCIVNKYSRSYKAFEAALAYIDTTKDKIRGVNLFRHGDGHEKEEIKDEFLNRCKELKIKDASFKYMENDKSLTIGKQFCNIINFGDEYIDFICMGHNIKKYDNFEKAPTVEVIKFAQTNIFFSPKEVIS